MKKRPGKFRKDQVLFTIIIALVIIAFIVARTMRGL